MREGNNLGKSKAVKAHTRVTGDDAFKARCTNARAIALLRGMPTPPGPIQSGRKGISCLFLRKSNRLFHSQSEKAIILILDFCHVCISYSVEGECSRLLSTLPVGYSLTHRNRRLFRSDSSTCAFVQGQIPSSRKVEDGLPGGRLTHKIKRSAYAFYPCQALLESESHLRYLHH